MVRAVVAFGSAVDISIQEHWPFDCVTRDTPVALDMILGILANRHVAVGELYLLVTDFRGGHYYLTQTSYFILLTIALSDTDSPMQCVDVVTPFYKKGTQSLSLIW